MQRERKGNIVWCVATCVRVGEREKQLKKGDGERESETLGEGVHGCIFVVVVERRESKRERGGERERERERE